MAGLLSISTLLSSMVILLSTSISTSYATCTYDANTDYFASAASQWYPEHASTFTVSYNQYYKKINITAPDGTGKSTIIALRVCGAPLVSNSELGINNNNINNINLVQLQLPVTRIGLLSTTQIPMVEMLGERTSIKAIYGSELVYSTCVRQGLSDSSIIDIKLSDWSYDTNALVAHTDASFCSAGPYGCPGTSIDIPVADNYEHSVLAVSEYIGFFSLFFNQESKAKSILHDINTRYTGQVTQQTELIPSVTTNGPKVLWAYIYQGGWTIGSCPNYYCELIKDAGGNLLTMSTPGTGSYGTYTTNEIASLIAQADIWLFTGDTWDTDIMTSTDSVLLQAMSQSPAVKNHQVFDLQKATTNAWFETRVAQPDAVLQDIASIITPKVFNDNNYHRIWFRNVYTESVGTLPLPSTCTDMSQPFLLQSQVFPLSTLSNIAPVTDSTTNGNTLSSGAIAGITVAVVAVAAIALGVAVFITLKGQLIATTTAVTSMAQPGTCTTCKDTNADGTFTLRSINIEVK